MIDLFLNEIKAGDVFIRIEDGMGGSAIRYYFFAGYVDDTKARIKVQEFGGKPRVINKPCPHRNELILLSPAQIAAKRLMVPNLAVILEQLEGKK